MLNGSLTQADQTSHKIFCYIINIFYLIDIVTLTCRPTVLKTDRESTFSLTIKYEVSVKYWGELISTFYLLWPWYCHNDQNLSSRPIILLNLKSLWWVIHKILNGNYFFHFCLLWHWPLIHWAINNTQVYTDRKNQKRSLLKQTNHLWSCQNMKSLWQKKIIYWRPWPRKQ